MAPFKESAKWAISALRSRRAAEAARIQQEQLTSYKQAYVAQLMAEKEEGDRIVQQARRAVEEERLAAMGARERAVADNLGE